MDGSESALLNPLKVVCELGIETFEETGVALLQSPQERAEWLAAEAARIDAAARHGRGPRFVRDPRDTGRQVTSMVEGRSPATLIDEELAIATTEGEPVVSEKDISTWRRDTVKAVRAAGKRGTWKGRRNVRGRAFADREKPSFPKGKGRYAGKCAVTPQVLREYDPSEVSPIIEAV